MVEGRDVKSGICYKDSKIVCGLPEKQDFCDEGTWEPPYIVADQDHKSRTCAYYPYTVVIGRCGPAVDGTPGICSNSASRCDDPAAFVARDLTCSITHDSLVVTADGEDEGSKVKWPGAGPNPGGSSPFRRWTTYGSCDGRCVWSSDDCSGGEVYANDDPACTANKVSIGACYSGYAYCVVSEDNCNAPTGEGEPYYSHQKLLDVLDVNCYLSTLPRLVTPPAPSPPPSTPEPTASPTSNPTTPTATANANAPVETLEDESPGLSQGAIIGICVGGGLLAFIAILGIQMHIQRKNKLKRDWKASKEPSRPAESIAIEDAQDGSADNVEEAVSVL